MGNAVIIKHGHARRIDAKTGADKGSVGASNVVVSAASDMVCIILVYGNGSAWRYDASTGAAKGSVGSPHVKRCSISGGYIILHYANRTSRRYDVRSGEDKGAV